MTLGSKFKDAKMLLVFSSQGVLVGMHSSLNLASQAMNIPAQSISLCCLGYHISCYGYYFRHYLTDKVEVVPRQDFGNLTVMNYDQMCGVERRYHDPKEMVSRKRTAEKKRNSIKRKKND